MAGSFSDYAESGVLSHLFRSDTLSKPGTLAIALCANVPTDSDTGALATGHELANTGGYARQVLAPADANWTFTYTNGSGTVANGSTITFPVATADWGWVSGVAICDSGVYGAGHYIAGGALAVPKLIGAGDQFKMNAGDLALYLD